MSQLKLTFALAEDFQKKKKKKKKTMTKFNYFGKVSDMNSA